MLIIFLRKRKKNYLDNGGINMKKSTVLSLATAGAIVATSLGTFAAWDSLNATSTGTLQVGNPVTISAAAATYDETHILGQDPVYTSEVTFNVDKAGQTVSELDVTNIAVYASDDEQKATPMTDSFTITIAGAAGDTGAVPSGPTMKDTSVEDKNTYTVTLTPKDTSLQGKEFVVDVEASIK